MSLSQFSDTYFRYFVIISFGFIAALNFFLDSSSFNVCSLKRIRSASTCSFFNSSNAYNLYCRKSSNVRCVLVFYFFVFFGCEVSSESILINKYYSRYSKILDSFLIVYTSVQLIVLLIVILFKDLIEIKICINPLQYLVSVMVKCFALFSGGLDSSLAIAHMKSLGIEVIALNFVSHFFGGGGAKLEAMAK